MGEWPPDDSDVNGRLMEEPPLMDGLESAMGRRREGEGRLSAAGR